MTISGRREGSKHEVSKNEASKMKSYRIMKAIKVMLFAVLFVGVFGFVVMSLWNWLMPIIFGLHPIHFWQAVGLLILSKILFGGFYGRHGGRMHWRKRMMERWGHMTPEEREKFRQNMRHRRCGPFEDATAEPKA
jgi:nitrate reductase NapE component